MSNGSKVLIYLSFLLFLKEADFQLLLQFQTNIYLTTKGGPWYFWSLFGEQTSRILEPSPQGLISSSINTYMYIASSVFKQKLKCLLDLNLFSYGSKTIKNFLIYLHDMVALKTSRLAKPEFYQILYPTRYCKSNSSLASLEISKTGTRCNYIIDGLTSSMMTGDTCTHIF